MLVAATKSKTQNCVPLSNTQPPPLTSPANPQAAPLISQPNTVSAILSSGAPRPQKVILLNENNNVLIPEQFGRSGQQSMSNIEEGRKQEQTSTTVSHELIIDNGIFSKKSPENLATTLLFPEKLKV